MEYTGIICITSEEGINEYVVAKKMKRDSKYKIIAGITTFVKTNGLLDEESSLAEMAHKHIQASINNYWDTRDDHESKWTYDASYETEEGYTISISAYIKGR